MGPLCITRAAVLSADSVDLACSPETDDVGTPFTRVLRLRSTAWRTQDIDQHTACLCQYRDGSRTALLAMSREGALLDLDASGSASKIEDVALRGKPYQLGFLSVLRQVGGALFAAGSGGQAYRREPEGNWRVLNELVLDGPYPDAHWIMEYLINPELFKDPEMKRRATERVVREAPKRFWTLAGTSENSVYFGGEQAGGMLYFWDGMRLSACDLPTNLALRNMLVAPDGELWVCGREGILLRGRERRFQVVAELEHEFRFASLAWFRQRLYVGADSGPHALFFFDGQSLRPVQTGLVPELEDVHTLFSVDDVLWVVGVKSLTRFDGQSWERIPVPGIDG